MLKSLNDSNLCALHAGATKVWYYKPAVARYITFGEVKVDPKNLEATHVLLGSIAETHLEAIFGSLQGECWSPNGEARELITSKELNHTSMSVGDVIEVNGRAYECKPFGFAELV
jgi:hypothetical protein